MTRLTTGIVAVLLAFVATGCGEDGGSGSNTGTSDPATATSEETSGGGDAVAWADEVCGSLKEEVAALSTTPDIDPANLQATKDGLVTYLGTLESSFDGMASAVEDAGTPPVENGEETVQTFLDQIGTAKEAVTSAKTKMEAAPVDDPAAFQAAVTTVGEELTALGESNPTDAFDANQELKAAYDEAPNCQELESGSSTPTS
jgi:hypothetical protein